MKKINFNKFSGISNVVISLMICLVLVVCSGSSVCVDSPSAYTYSAIYNGNREKSTVSIAINVYENQDIVLKMLDVLDKHNAKATFFVGGCWADDNELTLKTILERGHELGNHGYFHKDHKKLSSEENIKEIKNNHEVVKALTGYEMKLFAPPSGSYSNITLSAALDLGYQTVMWSKDTIDWRDKDEDLIYSRATKNVCGGDIVLMHPKTHTLNVLDKIITYYNSVGLKVVTVSDCLE